MRGSVRRRFAHARGFAALLVLLAPLACREGPEPFAAETRPPLGDPPWRLTYNPGDDRGPVWSANGDSVYYTADGFDHLPSNRGVLVRIPGGGGIAEPLLPGVQNKTAPQRRLMAPVRSPAAARIAFAELWLSYESAGTDMCAAGVWRCDEGQDTTFSIPPLGAVMCRVRDAGATGRLEDAPSIRVDFAGWELVSPGPPVSERLVSHPFQTLYNTERALVFRPSWSPDGGRIVLSDGLRLLIWRPGDTEATPIPGTDDGVGPAWSPDGEWIAYTHLERGASRTVLCNCVDLGISRRHERTVFDIQSRAIRLVRPDGSEQIDLATGEEPAWTPDGSTLIFRADDQLWRIGRDGSGLAPIPGTIGGREPAVSPDGRFLAFTRDSGAGMHDIWVTLLDAQP